MALILVLVFCAVFGRLYSMIVVKSDGYVARASTKSTKTITVYGRRGTIYDTNMVPLAYDETSYNVTFYRDPTKSSEADRANYTQVLITVIRLVESNGKTTVNNFWMQKDEDGVWRFNSGSSSEAVEASRERQWRANFYMTSVPEEELFDTLLEKYCIPKDLDEEMTVKVLSLWQESRMNAFNSLPVTIAYDVGFETVSEIESMSMELDGIDGFRTVTGKTEYGSLVLGSCIFEDIRRQLRWRACHPKTNVQSDGPMDKAEGLVLFSVSDSKKAADCLRQQLGWAA